MAIIVSGATSDQWTIDPTSKAGRVTYYRTDASVLFPVYTGSNFLNFQIASTATSGTVFAMRNTSGSTKVFIRSIRLVLSFSGTAASTRSIFNMCRFNGATPTGGTNLTVVKKDNSLAGTAVGFAAWSASGAVSMTGTSVEAPFHQIQITSQNTVDRSEFIDFSAGMDGEFGTLFLQPGSSSVQEGLVVQANGTLVSGCNIFGSIAFQER